MAQFAGCLLAFVFVGCTAEGKDVQRPRAILIIRHAEKPDDPDSVHLSAQGHKRAEALPDLFGPNKAFPTPDFIFATKDTKHSHRPVETVTPLAGKLKVAVNDNFKDESFDKLAREILKNPKYAGKVVLISWHQGTIPDLANELGAKAPDNWKNSVFDRVWEITFDERGKARFRNLPQRLLPGDTEK